ncbi:FAD-dependent oxidoreductase [Variovorax saccharolyticus]|uniref:FAD-dependent oxidoreductase n=1 Tax=Variovorax saccharolyticus TaxID=3053516 RepID=UPI0025762D76|nr:FAD-dependent oxidoreductase [Variovorax sp. J22R187]MDM0020192.1 FAD-dependent oxidoreductase [Variovorax sp. J22R187]
MSLPTELPFRSAAVLGAGLMGRLLALALARAGCEVDVYEAGGPEAEGAAARVAAAMLAPLAESAVAPASVVRMGHHALDRWPALIASLAAPVFFQREGTLVLWHRQDAAEAARLRRVLARTGEAVPELPAMQVLDVAGIEALEPSLGRRFAQALLLPDEGQLDNRALLAALRDTLQAQPKVRLHWHAPRSTDDFAPGEPGQPERVIDCRGLGAKPQWNALRGVRGEVIRVHAPEVTLQRPTRLVHPRYPIYIAPKPDHLFVIGATEIESDDMSPASVRSTLELLSAAYAVHSGFAEARIVEIATQCRPTLPDNLPALRQLRPHVMQINGLYRHGFMIAPAILDVAMELLATGRSALAARFGLAPNP